MSASLFPAGKNSLDLFQLVLHRPTFVHSTLGLDLDISSIHITKENTQKETLRYIMLVFAGIKEQYGIDCVGDFRAKPAPKAENSAKLLAEKTESWRSNACAEVQTDSETPYPLPVEVNGI